MSDEPAGFEPGDGTPVHDEALDALMAGWVTASAEPIDVEGALAQVNARRRRETAAVGDELAARRQRRAAPPVTALWQRPVFRIAAALIAVAGVAAVMRMQRPPAATSYVTTTGTSSAIRLADGTDVRLGPGSRLTLQAGYGTSHRRVTLQGEAWFRVTHDVARPFAIRVGATTVEDVGTAFLVRESEAREVSVRVAEGLVRVTTPSAARDSSVTLRAGDGAVASATGIAVAAGRVTASEGAALAAGRLTFTDASLLEVRESLHRWYGVTLHMDDSVLAARHVTADFTGEPLSRVASVLGLTLGVEATVHGDTIELRDAAGVPARP